MTIEQLEAEIARLRDGIRQMQDHRFFPTTVEEIAECVLAPEEEQP
jgi:hypothetical protein